MWYALNNYSEIEGNNPSLVVAFSNLLKKFDKEIDPKVLGQILTQDDPVVDWWSLPEYIENVKYDSIVTTTVEWPNASNSIVRLERKDPHTGQFYDHYCLVADHNAKSIIDSEDGKVKNAGGYSNVTGYAIYSYGIDAPEDEDFLTGVRPADDSRIVYETFKEPKKMHISKPNTRKWSFGNVKTWNDLKQTGPTYPQFTNLVIYGVAHVPVSGKTAAYYMDSVGLGDFRRTGRVAFTTGYSWTEIAEGHIYEKQVPVEEEIEVISPPLALPEPEKVLEVIEDVAVSPEIEEIADELAIEELKEPASPNAYKATYQAFIDEFGERHSIMFIATRNTFVKELDGRRDPKILRTGRGVAIAGTFIHEDVVYGRPQTSIESGLWYGIDLRHVESEDNLFDTSLSLHEKTLMHNHLSVQEQVVVQMSKALSQYTKALDVVNKKIRRK